MHTLWEDELKLGPRPYRPFSSDFSGSEFTSDCHVGRQAGRHATVTSVSIVSPYLISALFLAVPAVEIAIRNRSGHKENSLFKLCHLIFV